MPNFKYAYKVTFAYIKRFKWILLLGVIFGVIIFFLIKYLFPILTRPRPERIGVTGRYHTDTLPSFVLSEISYGLTKIDDNKNVVPSLASAWETPDKGKTWIFHLSDDQVWHDGSKVNSDSIAYEFSDVEVQKSDDKTISFKLQNIFSPFPSVLARPTFKKGLLGTGTWKVEKVQLSGGFVTELQILNSDDRKKVYKFYPTLERTKLAFKLGEVDSIIEVLDPKPFDNWKTTTISENVYINQVVTLFFNTQDKVLSEKNLRQALTYAIDKEKLGERAISPISPSSWAYNPQVKKYAFDKTRAKELINDLPKEAKSDLKINLVTTTNLLNVAEQISNDWKEIGVETRVQVSSIIPSEFQTFLTIYDIPQDPDQYSIWHSTQITTTNISKYSSARIDKLLEEGRTSLDMDQRKNTYLDFQRFVLEDLPAAFLYHPKYYTIKRS